MITLCGFSVSNYYNKVKLVLLEKNIPFEEKLVWTDRSPTLLQDSPLGKIPYIETEEGVLCESQVILDYVDQRFPDVSLLSADPFTAAKQKERIVFLELHLELVARELYAEAFFGGVVSDETKQRIHKILTRNIKALANVLRFEPYLGGSAFSLTDCAGLVHLPVISLATKIVYGEDLLADWPIKDYLALLAQRPHVQTINADRKQVQQVLAQRMASKPS